MSKRTTMEKITAPLGVVNLFKSPIRLKLNKRDFISSRPGELFSLAIYGYLLYALITSDVFSKLNPNVLTKDTDLTSYPWFNYTKDNFFFGGYVSDQNGVAIPYDPRYYYLVASYYNYSTNMSTGVFTPQAIKNAILVPCIKQPYVLQNMASLVKQFPLAFCLPQTEFPIGGYFSEPKSSYLIITLQRCNNASTNNSCKTTDQINSFFVNKKLAYILRDNNFASDNHDNPFSPKYTPFYFNLDYRVKKVLRIDLQQVQVYDDDDILTTSNNLKESWTLGDMTSDFDLDATAQIAEIDFRSTTKVTIINRTYQKIQGALSNLGGIVNVLISVGFILLSFGPYSGMDLTLSNHLFSFRSTKDTNKKDDDQDGMSKNTEKHQFMAPESPTHDREKDFEENMKATQNLTQTRGAGSIAGGILDSERYELRGKPKHESIKISDISPFLKIPELSEQIEMQPLQSESKKIEIPPEKLELPTDSKKMAICPGDEPILEVKSVESEKVIKENSKGQEDIREIFKKKMTMRESASPEKKFKKTSTLKTPQSPRKSFVRKRTLSEAEKRENNKIIEDFRNYSRIKKKKNALDLSLGDFLKTQGFRNFFRKFKALHKAKEKIAEDLDIMNIMEKFQELDKLKLILLNAEQLMLFNLIAKPEIMIDENEAVGLDPGQMISENLKKIEEKTDQNLLNFVVYYNKIKDKVDANDLDARLLKLVDDDMKKYFNI